MNTTSLPAPSREQLVHLLYEAAELEHNLMCTYLYAAFSLRQGVEEGLSPIEAEAVSRWRRTILDVAIEEMGHLTAVWNITSALGAAPRFGRGNFPLDPGYLPAGVVVKLAPFNAAVLQHFIHLERPEKSIELDGEGFAATRSFKRGMAGALLTPMPIDYDTVGEFYATVSGGLQAFVAQHGEAVAFCGEPGLQLSTTEVNLVGARPVICAKTAISALNAIVVQGEGAPADSKNSHFQKFVAIREELQALTAANPDFVPSHPAAHNPVLRRPPTPEGKIWLEDADAIATVDLANAAYQLMLRLMAYAYSIVGPDAEKRLAVELAITLMRATTWLGERAARLPAGAAHPDCNAGMSFTALRDAASLVPGHAARTFFIERLEELRATADTLDASGDSRAMQAARIFAALAERARKQFASLQHAAAPAVKDPAPASAAAVPGAAPIPVMASDGFEEIDAQALTLRYSGKRCIHARFCVTKAPTVFLANVQGPWIYPDAMDVEELAAIARECPSGAIQYRRKDGHADESVPPVNLTAVREAGPYAMRGQLLLDGEAIGYRATLCRCGASKNKPFCDGSHHDVNFDASGEPPSGQTDMLPQRDGVLAIDPEIDGPLQVSGNLEITSGTGRVVARVTQARLCRCGGSATKPFCDGTHARIGFRSS